MKKIILIHTDGYSIDYDNNYTNLGEAQKAMECQYNDYMPSDGLSPEWEDMSYINDGDAILYANGEAVHVWKIIAV